MPADRFAAIDDAGITAHQSHNNAYMDALSEINENGEVVPNEAKALAASRNAAAAVKRVPGLLGRYAAGMNAGQRTALKAFIITLDLRDEMLEASAEMIRAKADEIKLPGGIE